PRSTDSWCALLEIIPGRPASETPREPNPVLNGREGLAVLRREDRYVGVECGPQGGGHGHPDKLQLMQHANGAYGLPDPDTGSEDHLLELPWHIAGRGAVETRGRWVDDELPDEFVTRVQRFVPDAPGPVVLSHVQQGRRLTAHLSFDGALLEMEGPGLPGEPERAKFYVVRALGRNPRFITVLETHEDQPAI